MRKALHRENRNPTQKFKITKTVGKVDPRITVTRILVLFDFNLIVG